MRWPEPEAKSARDMLQFPDIETLVTCGVLADCGDEFDVVLRYMDTEIMDVATMFSELQGYINTMIVLFVEGKVTSVSGYTKHIIEGLSEQRRLIIDGETKIIGGEVPPSKH